MTAPRPPDGRSDAVAGLAWGLLAAAIWSVYSVLARWAVTSGLTPADLTLMRFLPGPLQVAGITAVVLGLLVAFRAARVLVTRRGWARRRDPARFRRPASAGPPPASPWPGHAGPAPGRG